MFNVGDMIKVIDGNNIEGYMGGWFEETMSHLVGNVYEVIEFNGYEYKIYDEQGKSWHIDTRGAVAPETEVKAAPETVMVKKSDFALDEEQEKSLVKASMRLLGKYEFKDGYNYEPTERGLKIIFAEWQKQKGWLIDLFRKHPSYNGKGQIILTEEYAREIDHDIVKRFSRWVARQLNPFKEGVEVTIDFERYGRETGTISVFDYSDYTFQIDGIDRWFRCEEVKLKEERDFNVFFFDRQLARIAMQYADEDFTREINAAFPWLKAHHGAKVSKLINRICKHYKLNEHEEFNRRYTQFADAINPLNVTRYTVLSVHPIDFWEMSHGNDWTSCHSIDKTDLNGTYSGSYHGCYSAGTESYMLDESSFVVYIVDKSYDGNEFELQPKLSRQMFHIGEDKLVQGRLYPQDNDVGAQDTYKQIREIVQRVISQCLNVDNLWTNTKGTDVCSREISSYGLHYRDYEMYDNCNVSYLNRGTETKNHKRIKIGATAICPTCGSEHYNQECILCESCAEVHTCRYCGEAVDLDYSGIEINGDYYCCSDCAERYGYVYCTNDEEWHHGDSSEVFYDDYLCEYQYDYYEEYITTMDGHHYSDEEYANRDGYYRCDDDDEFYHESELVECESCGRMVPAHNYDDESGACDLCATTKQAEGNGVVVVKSGKLYSNYERWVDKYAKEYKDVWAYGEPLSNGDVGTIVAVGEHENDHSKMYGILVRGKLYVIGADGVEEREVA